MLIDSVQQAKAENDDLARKPLIRRACGRNHLPPQHQRERRPNPKDAEPGDEQACRSPHGWLTQSNFPNRTESMAPGKRFTPDGAALGEGIAPQGKPENILEETPEKFAQDIDPASQAVNAGRTSLTVVLAEQGGAEDCQRPDHRMMDSNPAPAGKNQAKAHQQG